MLYNCNIVQCQCNSNILCQCNCIEKESPCKEIKVAGTYKKLQSKINNFCVYYNNNIYTDLVGRRKRCGFVLVVFQATVEAAPHAVINLGLEEKG